MRIIGRIDDPRMNITIFENDGRYPVQFELAGLTQIYRFRKGPKLDNPGRLRTLIDEDFRKQVLDIFGRMRVGYESKLGSLSADTTDADDLPNIL